jgi:hypothetical protein
MIDPALTFDSTDLAVQARERLLRLGVAYTVRGNLIRYWLIGPSAMATEQLGKTWSARLHRPFTHLAVGHIRETAARQVAVTFHFLHLPRDAGLSRQWAILPIRHEDLNPKDFAKVLPLRS